MLQRQSRWRTTLATLVLDLALTGSMLALFSVNLTGLRLHEWLGLGVCILIPTHMLINWSWLAAITRQLVGPLPWRVRLRYLLNASLFVALVVVTLSGLVISEVLFPSLARIAGNAGFWHPVHTMASNATLALVGLHLGMYWRNVVNMLRRLVTRERRGTVVRARAGAVAARTGV